MPLLAEHFLKLTCEKFATGPRRFAPETVKALQGSDWSRNNIRELRNVVDRAVALAGPSPEPGALRWQLPANGALLLPPLMAEGGVVVALAGPEASPVLPRASRIVTV